MSLRSMLIDCLRYPDKLIKQRDSADTNPSRARKVLLEQGFLRDNYPNFNQIGFRAQAFVDIEMNTKADPQSVKLDLHKIRGVIMIYTVFGDVDMRCKVVGTDLQSVEKVAMDIRQVTGVKKVSTSVIVDESLEELMRENWAGLIADSKEKNLNL